jgi:aminoglycoside N3'-acetyltransferase
VSSIDSGVLVNDLKQMGVVEGDTLFVRASLGKVGRVKGGGQTILDALLTAVGTDGTLVSLAYTDCFLLRAKSDYVFDQNTESTAGSLPNLMLKHAKAFRSLHPTNSIVAIGAKAAQITSDHDATSNAYEPIRHLVNLDAKMMLIGCVNSSPGFTTAHLAELDLGLYKRLILAGLYFVKYRDASGGIKVFRYKDPGLCSISFQKFYSEYITNEILTTGKFGKAYTIWVPAKKAYAIEFEKLKKNKKYNLCDRPFCSTCNALRWDRLHRLPVFIFYKLLVLFKNKAKGRVVR